MSYVEIYIPESYFACFFLSVNYQFVALCISIFILVMYIIVCVYICVIREEAGANVDVITKIE